MRNTIFILNDAQKNKYAVGAFNVNSLDQVPALIKLAESCNTPILIVLPAIIEKYVAIDELAAVTIAEADKVSVPVGLHLSHGDMGAVERCIRAGFTSVMFDGSLMELKENIRYTKIASEMGHKYGTAVEGELGAVGAYSGSKDDNVVIMTDPQQAKEFVEGTDVDIMAVSIGNAHGFYKGVPKLDFERLAQIKEAVKGRNVYLTLHGGTGIPDSDMKKAIREGITKICIYTEMCAAGKDNAIEYLAKHPKYENNYDVPELLKAITDGFVAVARRDMEVFGGLGRGA
jgi:fructose-bisphosphate aldolase class II